MMRVRTAVAGVVMATAALGSMSAPASATPTGGCNGAADAACTYCGHYSGNGYAYPYSYCYNNPGSYRFTTCYAWASGRCYVG